MLIRYYYLNKNVFFLGDFGPMNEALFYASAV